MHISLRARAYIVLFGRGMRACARSGCRRANTHTRVCACASTYRIACVAAYIIDTPCWSYDLPYMYRLVTITVSYVAFVAAYSGYLRLTKLRYITWDLNS